MACNCGCKKDDDIIGGNPDTWTPKKPMSMKMILILLLLIAVLWYFFVKSKRHETFFEAHK
jgi:hypothetical protein